MISVGDGGNEVGMGKVQELVKKNIMDGDIICADTTCDYLIVADTSNFGGYVIVEAIII